MHAHKQLAFVDELTDTVHEFILLMSAPISQITFAKIGISSYTGNTNDYAKYENPEAIAYIENEGAETSKKILDQLNSVKPVLSKMQSLSTKGQILGIANYSKCMNACNMLQWSHNLVEVFGVIIGSQHMNWEHPEVQKHLLHLIKINPEEIRANLAEQNKEIISFAKGVYESSLK